MSLSVTEMETAEVTFTNKGRFAIELYDRAGFSVRDGFVARQPARNSYRELDEALGLV